MASPDMYSVFVSGDFYFISNDVDFALQSALEDVGFVEVWDSAPGHMTATKYAFSYGCKFEFEPKRIEQ